MGSCRGAFERRAWRSSLNGPGVPQRVPGNLGQSQTLQDQADGQVADQAARRSRPGRSVAANLHLPDHPRPAAQQKQGRGQELLPLRLGDAEQVERFHDGLERTLVGPFQPVQLGRQPAQPALRRTAGLPVQGEERLVKAFLPARQDPVGEALIEERGTEANQHVIDQQVAVLAGGFEQQVPVSRRWDRHVQLHAVDPIPAEPPQGPQCHGLPGGRAPALDRGGAEVLEDVGQGAAWSRRSCPAGPGSACCASPAIWLPDGHVAHDPVARLFQEAFPDRCRRVGAIAAQGVGLGREPAQLRVRRDPERMLQHRQTQFQARAEAQDALLCGWPQFLLQDGHQLGGPDPPADQLLTVAVFREVRLAAEDPGPLLDRLMEGQLLEGMQGIVMHKDRDRSLGRQEVGRVLDHLTQRLEPACRLAPRSRGAAGMDRVPGGLCHWYVLPTCSVDTELGCQPGGSWGEEPSSGPLSYPATLSGKRATWFRPCPVDLDSPNDSLPTGSLRESRRCWPRLAAPCGCP